MAFGGTDTQDYVSDARNVAIVDFNTLANIEPTADVFWLPPGSGLELREDGAGKFFVDIRTGQEYLEPVKHPLQADFPTGEVVLADPLVYLGRSYETVLERRGPAGRYPVELSMCLSQIAGPRIAAARLVLREDPAVRI